MQSGFVPNHPGKGLEGLAKATDPKETAQTTPRVSDSVNRSPWTHGAVFDQEEDDPRLQYPQSTR